MHVLETRGLPLPEIVVVDPDEVSKIRRTGLPYVVKPTPKFSDEKILKSLLFGVLQKMFPYVIFDRTFGNNVELVAPVHSGLVLPETMRTGGSCGNAEDSEYWIEEEQELVDRDGYRYTVDDSMHDPDDPQEYGTVSVEKLWADGAFQVDVSQLMDAGLLPKFLMDIGEAIRHNLKSYTWLDCWNRKLGLDIGEFNMTDERPNLIVLDISGSIPRGVAYTMVGLIDTLRQQANADLIVNSGSSQWWPKEEPIDLHEINAIIGGCNEARQFYQILDEHVLGKKWGNVIGFGDEDAPMNKVINSQISERYGKGRAIQLPEEWKWDQTEIGNVLGYHTRKRDMPGYLLWTRDCKTEQEQIMGCSWVRQVKRR